MVKYVMVWFGIHSFIPDPSSVMAAHVSLKYVQYDLNPGRHGLVSPYMSF